MKSAKASRVATKNSFPFRFRERRESYELAFLPAALEFSKPRRHRLVALSA